MAALLDPAFQIILKHEGGFCVDSGGPTKWGIILPVLREMGLGFGDKDQDGDIDADDIRKLTPDDAKEILRVQWWDRYGYGRLSSQNIANRILDASFNMGPKQGHLIAQRAARACGYPLIDDGILGQKSLAALNALPEHQFGWMEKIYLAAFSSEMAGVYRMILAKHPDWEEYRPGWIRRAYWEF